jgi:hypothetical protein
MIFQLAIYVKLDQNIGILSKVFRFLNRRRPFGQEGGSERTGDRRGRMRELADGRKPPVKFGDRSIG